MKYHSVDQGSESICVSTPHIFKFGGSSLASANGYRNAVQLIQQHLSVGDFVVVSASGNTTDQLTALFNLKHTSENLIATLWQEQQKLIQRCLPNERAASLSSQLSSDIQWLNKTFTLDQPEHWHDEVLALGEIWSARLLCALLESHSVAASWLDSRQCFIVGQSTNGVCLNQALSKQHLADCLISRKERITVVTGFIASDVDQRTVTLGRNGSDYSATLLAQLVGARQVTLWTDVAGVYNFDPHIDDTAQPIKNLNHRMATQLAQLGSPVFHPRTIEPLEKSNIKLCIRSSFTPEQPGSQIDFSAYTGNETIITHQNHLCLISFETGNDISCKRLSALLNEYFNGYHEPLFYQLREQPSQLDLIVQKDQLEAIQNNLKQHTELFANYTVRSCSLLSLISDNLANKPFHITFFNHFISQLDTEVNSGRAVDTITSELAISCIVFKNEIDNVAKQCFQAWQTFRSSSAVFLLGIGQVGGTWQQQFAQHPSFTKTRGTLALTANTQSFQLYFQNDVFKELPNKLESLTVLIKESPFIDNVVIDATASHQVSEHYDQFFESGAHVISANKINSSASKSVHQRLLSSATKHDRLWLQNATIGAGLPINNSVKDLLRCGDRIKEIRGVFSGTLSWLLQTYDGSRKLSELVEYARQLGITEPEPAIDLSGIDVARKLIVAARLCEFEAELSDVERTPLIDQRFFQELTIDWKRHADAIDDEFHHLWLTAAEQKQKLVYQAACNSDSLQCKLVSLPESDPLAQLSPSDNIFVVTTQWYDQQPLIIRGPGAGKQVTAAAIQSDLLTILDGVQFKAH